LFNLARILFNLDSDLVQGIVADLFKASSRTGRDLPPFHAFRPSTTMPLTCVFNLKSILFKGR
jgi:hypothetical protein